MGKQVTEIGQNEDSAVQMLSLKSSRLSLRQRELAVSDRLFMYPFFLFVNGTDIQIEFSYLQGVPLTS